MTEVLGFSYHYDFRRQLCAVRGLDFVLTIFQNYIVLKLRFAP